MAKMPFTSHGFHLRPVPEVIDTLRGGGSRSNTDASAEVTVHPTC